MGVRFVSVMQICSLCMLWKKTIKSAVSFILKILQTLCSVPLSDFLSNNGALACVAYVAYALAPSIVLH